MREITNVIPPSALRHFKKQHRHRHIQSPSFHDVHFVRGQQKTEKNRWMS